MSRHLLPMLFIMTILASCSKERAPEFTQTTQEEYLKSISNFNGKTFKVMATGGLSSSSQITAAESDPTLDGQNKVKDFPLVTYKTQGDELGLASNILLRGEVGKTYTFSYGLTNTKIILYKHVKKSEAPSYEFVEGTPEIIDYDKLDLVLQKMDALGTSLDDLKSKVKAVDSLEKERELYKEIKLKQSELAKLQAEAENAVIYRIPIYSYGISIYKYMFQKDGNGENTNKRFKLPVNNLSEAVSFSINYSSGSPTSYDAVNEMPATLFSEDDEWYFSATITEASETNTSNIGGQLGFDISQQEEASRVQFRNRKGFVKAVSLNVDDDIDQSNDLNLNLVLELPVERFSKMIKQDGPDRQAVIKRIDADSLESRNWRDLKFIKVDFTKVRSAASSSEKTVLHDFVYSKDYFSFDLEYVDSKIRVKYSFMKANNRYHPNLKPKRYPKDDQKIFGFFTGNKNFVRDDEFYREDDFQNQITISKHMPENGEIVYHMSVFTDDKFKKLSQDAVDIWDKAFQKAGTGMRVKLDTSKKVKVGDIRYNVINIIDNIGGDAGGYGPQLVDPLTGEIISATANVRAGGYREEISEQARNYIKAKLGFFNDKYIGVTDTGMESSGGAAANGLSALSFHAEESLPNLDSNSGRGSKLQSLIRQFKGKQPELIDPAKEIYGYTSSKYDLNDIDTSKVRKPYKNAKMLFVPKKGVLETYNMRQCYNYDGGRSSEVVDLIKEHCGADIDAYVDSVKADESLYNTTEELKVLNVCKDKIIDQVLLGVVLHEMGHNLGLRHNFLADTDRKNFAKPDDFKTPQSASVMDYFKIHNVKDVGSYDVEAIRYGYAQEVLAKDGSKVKLIEGKSIKEAFAQAEVEFEKRFKYCTDEDIQRWQPVQGGWLVSNNQVDPLCQRFQPGDTPLEVVKNSIAQFESDYAVYGSRYDRNRGPDDMRFGMYAYSAHFQKIKKIYDQWRFHLKKFIESSEEYRYTTSGYLENLDEKQFQTLLQAMAQDEGVHGKNFQEYFQASQLAYVFLQNIVKIPTRYCQAKLITDSVSIQLLPFEQLRSEIFENMQVVASDCDDMIVANYLESKGLQYLDKRGHFFNGVKRSLEVANPEYDEYDHVGINIVQRAAILTLTERNPQLKQHFEEQFAPSFMDSPWYRPALTQITMSRIINGVNTNDLKIKISIDPSTITDAEVNQVVQGNMNLMLGFMSLESTIQTLSEEIMKLDDQIEKMEEQMAALGTSSEETTDEETELPAQETELREEVNELAEQAQEVQEQDAQTTQDLQQAQQQLDEAEEEGDVETVETLTAKIAELKKKQLETAAQIADMQQRIQVIRSQIRSELATEKEEAGKFYPFFAEKQEVLMMNYVLLAESMRVPGKQKASEQRSNPFAAIINPQLVQQYLQYAQQNPQIKLAQTNVGGRTIIATQDSYIAYTIIEDRNNLVRLREAAINGVEKLVEEKLEKALKLILPTTEDFATKTPAKIMEELQATLQTKTRELQQLMDGVTGPVIQTYFQSLIQNIQQMAEAQGSSEQSDAQMNFINFAKLANEFETNNIALNEYKRMLAEIKAKMEAENTIVEKTVKDILAESGVSMDQVPFVAEKIPEIIKETKAQNEQSIEEAKVYRKSFKEYEAQLQIYTNALLFMSM
ncbi:MAG: zinc-dependent metalloprotease [Bacteriovoracaceae bacterium]